MLRLKTRIGIGMLRTIRSQYIIANFMSNEMLSSLLAPCDEKPTMTDGFQLDLRCRALMFSCLLAWTNWWTNIRVAGDLIRDCDHVIVVSCWLAKYICFLMLQHEHCRHILRKQLYFTFMWIRTSKTFKATLSCLFSCLFNVIKNK